VKLSGPELLFVERFLITDSTSLLLIGLFKLSPQDSILVSCIFLGIYRFFSRLSNLLVNNCS